MKKILSLILIACFLALFVTGCSDTKSDDNADGDNDSVISTTEELPSKDELTVEKYKEKLENVTDYIFVTEVNTEKSDLSLFPYTGLESCALTSVDGVDTATFLVFDSEENAQKIIDETKANNTSGFDEEIGKNFVKITQDYVVVEKVGATVLTISCEDEGITKSIISATGY